MLEGLHFANSASSPQVCISGNDRPVRVMQTKPMTKKTNQTADHGPLHYLKQWREFRELTQEQLAEEVDTTKGVISLIESGDRGLSDKWARRLAPALRTRPGWLLDHDPNTLPSDILEVWSAIPKERQKQALKVLETFRALAKAKARTGAK